MFHEQDIKMNMRKQDIIEQAVAVLEDQSGYTIRWDTPQDTLTGTYDAIFHVGDQSLFVEAKNEVRPVQVEKLYQQKEQLGNLLVVADYITPQARELLRQKEINYADKAGNIWLKAGSILIFVEGISNTPPTEAQKNRAFTKSGIKVGLQILLDPQIIHTTYREIAEKSDVALGTIPKVMAGLAEEGFLLRKDRTQWLLPDYAKFLDRWQAEYARRLKPSLLVKRYKASDQAFYTTWQQMPLPENDVWGGEPAAAILTGYLTPGIFTLYTQRSLSDIMQTYRWLPDETGDIHVYRKFWTYPPHHDLRHLAPLVYADLVASGDSRCIETAHLLYEQYLAQPQK